MPKDYNFKAKYLFEFIFDRLLKYRNLLVFERVFLDVLLFLHLNFKV